MLHPELCYEEYHAHDTLCKALEDLGYSVTRHSYGLRTSFEAEVGTGGALVVYNAEMDALPGMGHACGHNLIATSSFAAFLATAEALRADGGEGRVRILGTPAEEDGGGKIDLLRAGAYQGVDACLMGHPGPGGSKVPIDGIANGKCMARASVTATFKGVNAHAGNAPWQGRNALDAAVAAYNSISMLRQQITPNQRIHAIIAKGGERPNVIPDLTVIELYARAESSADLEDTCQRLIGCFEGAARGAGCTVELEWHVIASQSYKELQCNKSIIKTFLQAAGAQGERYLETSPSVSGASTDQGNVSYEIPSLHPGFLIDIETPGIGPHHPDFEKSAGTRSAFEASLRFAKALAATGFNILKNKELRNQMWSDHKEAFGK
ncbi:Peptidase M20 domain-containing protein 2 [Penicillium rolfsii]|nr:Peptidase M20 domain-containing protein 2 [Penicillium rolfsii]